MITASVLLAMGLCTGNCRTFLSKDRPGQRDELVSTEEALGQCVALRGNGNWISTHFASLSRIVSDYGEIDGLAGGSSSSITMMIYESILLNPEVTACKPEADEPSACGDTPKEKQKNRERRIALLLKSVYGVMALAKSDLDKIIEKGKLALTWPKEIREIVEAFKSLPRNNIEDFTAKAKSLEKSLGLSGLVNPDFRAFLRNENAPAEFRLSEAWAALEAFQGFRVLDNRPFFRPGLINYDVFSDVIGRFADFYAGRFFEKANAAAFSGWIKRCDAKTTRKSWNDMMQAKSAAVQACAKDIYPILNTYLHNYDSQRELEATRVLADDEERVGPRILDQVGKHLPIMISTSVLDKKEVEHFKDIRGKFLNGDRKPGSDKDGSIVDDFNVGFENVHFGYWGPSDTYGFEVNERLNGTPLKKGLYPKDIKSQKFLPLGSATYKMALISIMEPGLGAMEPIYSKRGDDKFDTGYYSIGGWSDLHPVQVAKGMNCDRVIYVTRETQEAEIAIDATDRLNASKTTQAKLYYTEGAGAERYKDKNGELRKPDVGELSSFELALKEAVTPYDIEKKEQQDLGGVWCTRWNEYSGSKILAMAEDAYKARFYTVDPLYRSTEAPNIKDPRSEYVNGCTLEKSLYGSQQPN